MLYVVSKTMMMNMSNVNGLSNDSRAQFEGPNDVFGQRPKS